LDGLDSPPAESRKWTAVTVDFSPAAVLYGKLQNLADTDPQRFKKVMGDMASALKDEARHSSGSDARVISNLAAEYAKAAKTGSADPIAPQSLPGAFGNPYSSVSSDYGNPISPLLAQSGGAGDFFG
jgi:hypothetical protein